MNKDTQFKSKVMTKEQAITIAINYREAYEKSQADAAILRGALTVACDLLPVPEQHQDDEWYAKQKAVNEILASTTAGTELLNAAHEAKIALGNLACGLKMAEFDVKSGLSRECYYATPETEKAVQVHQKLKAALREL